MLELLPCEISKHIKSDTDFKITVFDELDSTNNHIKQCDAPENNTCIIARRQTGGRGRTGNKFFSPEGGLYMSLYRQFDANDFNAGLITSCTAVAVAKSIDTVCGTDCKIKWVNDVFLNHKKLCGILCETVCKNGLFGSIIGIGVNVKKTDLPLELQETVASLEAEGFSCDINALAGEILSQLDFELNNRDNREFLKESRSRSAVLGKTVTVEQNEKSFTATAVDIDSDGRLIIKRENKTEALEYGVLHIRF